MNDHRFDALAKTLTASDGSRRTIVRAIGGSALAAVVGRFAGEAADAKKKHKRRKKRGCKGETTKCGKKACCRADQICVSGQCKDEINNVPECLSDDDCAIGATCQDGVCEDIIVDPPCQGNADCDSGEICVAGNCFFVQGTCDATDDHCSVTEALCNPVAGNDCFCLQRFGGGAACIQEFVPDTLCGSCLDDADCAGIEEGSVCVTAATNGCPCDPGEGICARLCPNQ